MRFTLFVGLLLIAQAIRPEVIELKVVIFLAGFTAMYTLCYDLYEIRREK